MTQDLRLFLQREFLTRCKDRPGYSLRSFAKALAIDSTALSRILSGQRRITKSTFKKLIDRLDLSPVEVNRFAAKTLSAKSKARGQSPVYSELAHDTFIAMSTWYYPAILELPYLKDFKLDPKWMAKTLGITASEVNIAIDTLQRIGLIEITSDHKWIDKTSFFSTIQKNVTSTALRSFQKQVLSKATRALDEIPIERRDQTAMTFAVDQSRLESAKEKIKTFRREMVDFLQDAHQQNDSIYQLSISLFPLSTNVLQTP